MPDSAHGGPRVGALTQLNSHFDVGKVYSNPLSARPEYGNCDAVQLPSCRGTWVSVRVSTGWFRVRARAEVEGEDEG